MYRHTEAEPIFEQACAPHDDEFKGLHDKLIVRGIKMLACSGHPGRRAGHELPGGHRSEYPSGFAASRVLHYRNAFGPRAGQKVPCLCTLAARDEKIARHLCAGVDGFSVYPAVRCGADQRKQFEWLCRYMGRPALAVERLSGNDKGQIVLCMKSPYRDGITQTLMHPRNMQRPVALVPRPLHHLIRV